ncbi:MAG: hypothetical protein KAI70_07460 [Candidatus Omnitrophica bacterium]|nr:hypothetical protein [Candidatus Omnitrophota bacterium]
MFRKTEVIYKAILTLVLALFICVGNGFAEEGFLPEKAEWMPDISVSNDFCTKYIWRGQNLGEEPVLQNDYSLSKYGITLDLWTSYTLNNDKSKDGGRYSEYTEVDYTIDYSFSPAELLGLMGSDSWEYLEPLGVSIGYTYYTFPNVDWDSNGFDTHEVYVGASYDCLLQPSFTWYWDVEDGKGSYYQAGIGHTFEFEQGISADLGMTIAYNDEQWTTASGWSDMNFSGGVSIPVLTYFTVTPSVGYSVILDRDTYGDAQTNEFYGGLSIGFAY